MWRRLWKYYLFVFSVYATYVAWSVSLNGQNEMWMRVTGSILGFVNPMLAIDFLIAGIKIQWRGVYMVYKVLIEETQRMTVEIEANTPDEANRKATDGYENGDYDLDRSSDREYSVNVCCPDCGEFGALLGEWIDPADANHRGLICNMCGYCTGW